MKKKLFIHIWCPKTWTTTLQKSIFPNIVDKYFWLNVPNSQKNKILDNLRKYICFINNDKNPQIVNNLKEIIKKWNEKDYIISDETYSINHSFLWDFNDSMEWKANKIKKIKEKLKDICNIYIIISIRKQKEIIPSFFSQMWWYYTLNIDEFINIMIKEKVFDFYHIANYYSKLFWKNKIIIWTMDEIFNNSEDWIKNISKTFIIKDNNLILSNLKNTHENKTTIYKKKSLIVRIPEYIYKKLFFPLNKNKIHIPKYAIKIAKYLIKIQDIIIWNKKLKKIDKIKLTEKQNNLIYNSLIDSNKNLYKHFNIKI